MLGIHLALFPDDTRRPLLHPILHSSKHASSTRIMSDSGQCSRNGCGASEQVSWTAAEPPSPLPQLTVHDAPSAETLAKPTPGEVVTPYQGALYGFPRALDQAVPSDWGHSDGLNCS